MASRKSKKAQGNRQEKSPEEIAERRIQEACVLKARYLGLSNLGLRWTPKSIGQLASLERLNLSGNQLSTLPESIGQLTYLQSLDASDNQLSSLPESIGRLTRLQNLDVSNNRLSTLPESIGRLTNLRMLFVSYNQLIDLPDTISGLTNLQGFYGYDNRLSALPESIDQLKNLEDVHIPNNQLSLLPDAIQRLGKLKELALHGNDALGIPTEILGPNPSEGSVPSDKWAKPGSILEYFFRTRGGARPLNEAKLILVGRGTVGKTSLVKQLVEGKFDPQQNKTEGIGITPWPVKIGGNLETDVRVNIWDFGGQEIMHATHQFFLTERSLYLLVLNGREGGEDYDSEYWLKLISSFGGESPVIVVLNKIKQHPFDLNYRALQAKYPQIRAFIKTDCSPRTGIDELAAAVQKEIAELKDVHAKFPASWFSIKDALAGMKDNFMSLDRYRELCRKHNENDLKAQDDLAGFLHCLGIALNYRDDPRLRDTSILNPHWVTTGIYKLLNAEKLAKDKGVLRLQELRSLLPPADYPEEKHEYLMELMRKFKLCFSFPEDHSDHRYLVPELLDKQEPDLVGEFAPDRCLNFEYHYAILPEGLMPSFIVRTHALSEGHARWRSGAVLQWEQSRALVKADLAEKKIVIRVTGPKAEGQRRLLAVIRSDFERIHAEIPKLEVTAKVPLPGSPTVSIDYSKLVALEKKGIQSVPEVVGEEVTIVDVGELLGGVDLDETKRRKTDPKLEVKKGKRLFYSYSHKDESLRDQLETHLKLLQRQDVISTWHDRKILAGEEWKDAIDGNLESADIILLLVSADFIASDYCYEKEMKRAMERHEKGAKVIPIILRACDWKSAPFGKVQGLPKDAKPVMKWKDRDEAWNDVAQGIRRAIEGMR